MANNFRWFDQPAREQFPSNMAMSPSNLESYVSGDINSQFVPRQQGFLTLLGKTMSGIAAPFAGDYQWASRENEAMLRQQQADQEFYAALQKQRMEQSSGTDILKELDKRASRLDTLSKLGVDVSQDVARLQQQYGLFGQLGQQQSSAAMPVVGQQSLLPAPGSVSQLPPPMSMSGGGALGVSKFERTPAGTMVPKEFENLGIKAQRQQAEKGVVAEEQIKGTDDFISNFINSRQEILSRFPKAGEATGKGFIERVFAGATEATGQLPVTTAFINQLDVLANQQARDVEGGKVTDQDRTIYKKAMADALKNPDKTNVIQAGDALKKWKDYGNINKITDKYIASGDDILTAIALRAQGINDYNPSKQRILRNKKTGEYKVVDR